MFTGLVQAQGLLRAQGSDRFEILVQGDKTSICQDLGLGDSVAVDGICLTVETITSEGFIATASPETLARTTLGQSVRQQRPVNLETSLRAGGKIGGHFVTGHVDGVGCLISATETERSWEITFGRIANPDHLWEERIGRYLLQKGSVAVNGISLTVANCADDASWFQVAVIPVTYAETNLQHLEPGQWVNLESDILGKYVYRLLSSKARSQTPDISLDFLAEHGYASS
ncbi:MAG: riboflavin synthase [Cyanobacteria bacterium P01_H01_bin.15]